jgi:hypothetical protein
MKFEPRLIRIAGPVGFIAFARYFVNTIAL